LYYYGSEGDVSVIFHETKVLSGKWNYGREDIQYLWCFVDAKVIVSRLLLEYNSWKLNG
jgi:hypothetical protein